MNRASALFALLVVAFPWAGRAADWGAISFSPAQIEVVGMQPVPLVESTDKNGWARVPAVFLKYGAVIYTPANKSEGVADITVTADGYILVACNYDYQGNKSGKWSEEAWDEKKFKSKGWHEMSKHELDGELVKGDNKAQVIFSKQVHKGETLRVRCNKYDPPFPILLGVNPAQAK
jgi:hypothetical protein